MMLIVVSLANKTIIVESEGKLEGRSFMKEEKREGPSTELCRNTRSGKTRRKNKSH